MAKICFDFDGVLVRSRDLDGGYVWTKTREQDLGVSADLMGQLFAAPHWNEILCGKACFQDRLNFLFRSIDTGCEVEEFISYWLDRDLNWYADALDLLRELRLAGHDLYIATNQERIRSGYLRQRPEVKEYFKDLFTSSELGIAKPDLEFFRVTKASLNLTMGEIPIFIDDDARNVDAATQTGWKAIHFAPDFDENNSFRYLAETIASRAV